MIGRTISHYRIVEKLGEGGMGVVYAAEDTLLGRRVAIKTLTAHRLTQEPHFRARFLREARAISSLSHPHIATIHDYGETDTGEPYIVMELIKGDTLDDLIQKEALTIPRALEIIEQVAEALAEAHRHGIIHRDIKPSNVAINHRGEVKVLDFGLAKQINSDLADISDPDRQTLLNTQTQEGTILGTPIYLSPEQALGGEVDARGDLFSLGAVLYECIAGQPPFIGKNREEICARIIRDDPPRPSRLNANVPRELDRIALKALAKKPEERYQLATDLSADLKNVRPDSDSIRTLRKTAKSFPAASISGKRLSASRRLGATLLAVAIIAVVGGYLLISHNPWRRQPAGASINSIAVLPFTNESADPEIEYVCDGLTEALINGFSRVPSMKVIARSSVIRYKDQTIDPQSVGHELNVRALLIGRVVKHGDDFFINMELVDVEQNTRIWGERYNPKLLDLLSTQQEMTRNILNKLQPQLGSEQSERMAKKHTDNSEAYQLYLKGRYYWNKRILDKAIAYFQQAIQKDPKFALAYSGLADAYLFSSDLSPKETSAKGADAALKALAIDGNLAEAHTSLGFVRARYDWNWPEAEKEYRQALQLDPNYSAAYYFYADYLEVVGRYDEALTVLKRAQELDPLSTVINTELAIPLFYKREYDQAIEQFRRAQDLDPTFWETHYWLGLAYEQKGFSQESIKELESAARLSEDGPTVLAMLGYAYALSGKKDKAREILAKLDEASKHRHILPFNMAVIHLGLEGKDETFKWLTRSFEERDPALVKLKTLPIFDKLRQDERATDLIRRMGLSP